MCINHNSFTGILCKDISTKVVKQSEDSIHVTPKYALIIPGTQRNKQKACSILIWFIMLTVNMFYSTRPFKYLFGYLRLIFKYKYSNTN